MIQEAAKDSEKQRERLLEMQRANDVKRQELMDQENSLRTRESEMENSIMKAKQSEVSFSSKIENIFSTVDMRS